MTLIPKVSRELTERTRSFREDVYRSIALDDHDPTLAAWNHALQQVDPRILMVRALPRVVLGVPMKPGYYHLLRDNSDWGAPLSVTPIEGDHGEFVEPTSRIFEKLAAGNLHERRNMERYERLAREERIANEHEQEANKQERREHVKDLVDAYTRTSISTNDATPWTQNAQPNSLRARDEAKKRRP